MMAIPSPSERDRYLGHLHAMIAMTKKYQPNMRVLFDESCSKTAVQWELSERREQYGQEAEAYFTQHHLDSQREIERLVLIARERTEELLQKLHFTLSKWHGFDDTADVQEEFFQEILSQTKEHAFMEKVRDSLLFILEKKVFP